ncbi:MAG: Crp/Fnr family transcriptional regulator [Gammaproteobacteria bacterium]
MNLIRDFALNDSLSMKKEDIKLAWNGGERCQNCGVRHLVLFADLEQSDFSLIHEPIEEAAFDSGTTVYRASEDAHSVFTIRSGLVKLVRYLPDGTQRITRLLKQGDVLGLESVLGDRYDHTAVVLDRAEVCRIPRAVIRRLNAETPRLATQLMARWQQALSDADSWLTDLNTGTARERIARLLLRQQEANPDSAFHLLGREDIGAMLGITTETASRTVAQFKREGLIRDQGSGRVMADVDALEAKLNLA